LKPLSPAKLQTLSSNMKFLPVLAIFFAGVLAVPTDDGGRSTFDACPGALYSQTQCCGVGIGDIADIDCSNRRQ
jgi:hypothetical protein